MALFEEIDGHNMKIVLYINALATSFVHIMNTDRYTCVCVCLVKMSSLFLSLNCCVLHIGPLKRFIIDDSVGMYKKLCTCKFMTIYVPVSAIILHYAYQSNFNLFKERAPRSRQKNAATFSLVSS